MSNASCHRCGACPRLAAMRSQKSGYQPKVSQSTTPVISPPSIIIFLGAKSPCVKTTLHGWFSHKGEGTSGSPMWLPRRQIQYVWNSSISRNSCRGGGSKNTLSYGPEGQEPINFPVSSVLSCRTKPPNWVAMFLNCSSVIVSRQLSRDRPFIRFITIYVFSLSWKHRRTSGTGMDVRCLIYTKAIASRILTRDPYLTSRESPTLAKRGITSDVDGSIVAKIRRISWAGGLYMGLAR